MTTPTPAVWSDGDPLMTAIAAAVSAQCQTHPEQGLTVDDPRTIAAVAATVARQVLGTPTTAPTPVSAAPLAAGLPLVKGRCPACGAASLFLGVGGYPTCSRIDCPVPDAASTVLEQPASAPAAPPDRATDRRDRYAAALTSVWCQRAAEQVSAAPEEHCAVLADAAMAVADAEQRVKLGEQAEQYMARLRELAELVPDENAQPPADRATVLNAAADELAADRATMGHHAGAAQGMERAIRRLRRLADEAQPTAPWPSTTEYAVEIHETDEWVGISFQRPTLAEARARRDAARRRFPDARFRIVRWDEIATVAETDPKTATAATEKPPVVAHRLGGHHPRLHCLRCAPAPCGDIWTPLTSDDLPDGGVCGVCGADVLIPAATEEPQP